MARDFIESAESSLNREKRDLLSAFKNLRGNVTYLKFLRFVEIELELKKNAILDATVEELPRVTGAALSLRQLRDTLRNP